MQQALRRLAVASGRVRRPSFLSLTHSHENMGGSTQEIKRCPSCWTYFDHRKDDQAHAPNCSLASLFALFPRSPRFTGRQDSVLQAFSVVNGYIESNSHPPAVNSFQYGLSPVPQPGLPAILPPSSVPFYPPSFDPSQLALSCDLPEEASCVCIFKSMQVPPRCGLDRRTCSTSPFSIARTSWSLALPSAHA